MFSPNFSTNVISGIAIFFIGLFLVFVSLFVVLRRLGKPGKRGFGFWTATLYLVMIATVVLSVTVPEKIASLYIRKPLAEQPSKETTARSFHLALPWEIGKCFRIPGQSDPHGQFCFHQLQLLLSTGAYDFIEMGTGPYVRWIKTDDPQLCSRANPHRPEPPCIAFEDIDAPSAVLRLDVVSRRAWGIGADVTTFRLTDVRDGALVDEYVVAQGVRPSPKAEVPPYSRHSVGPISAILRH